MKTRIGLVGSGYMATEYLKASRAVSSLEFVAIHSRNMETAARLASEFGVSIIANSVEDFADQQLDFVIICVPELATFEIIATFSKLKVPLLVEKPVGITLREALSIEANSKADSIPLFVALNRRFYGSTRHVLNELAQTSGKRFVQVNDQENTIAAIAAGQPRQVVENWMFANSIHIIDYISVVCRGEPTLLRKNTTYMSKNAYIVHAEVTFSSGDVAIYTCFWNIPGGWNVSVSTENRTWQLSPLESARARSLGDRQYTDFEADELDNRFKPGLVRILMDLDNYCNGRDHSLISISEANKSMMLIDMIYAND